MHSVICISESGVSAELDKIGNLPNRGYLPIHV